MLLGSNGRVTLVTRDRVVTDESRALNFREPNPGIGHGDIVRSQVLSLPLSYWAVAKPVTGMS